MRAIGLAVTLGIIGLLAAGVACGGDSSPSLTENASPEGVTWVLHTLYGEPVIDGTFVWLRLDGDEYEGLDGCNRFGGRHEDGKQVATANGEFNAPPTAMTLIGCKIPVGILEQADRYIELLGQGESFRVEGDRLEILDWAGEVGLVFVRQVPLAGRPVELTGTAWELVLDDSVGEDVKAATLVFLDEHHAVGITACRGYVASYRVSDGRLRFPSMSMTEYGWAESCAKVARMQEGQFGNDLSRAIEYSVIEENGTRRLRIRTSRDRTAVFESMETSAQGVFDVEWRLAAIVDAGQMNPDRSLAQRTDRLIPGTEVTLGFGERGLGGSAGCNRYSSHSEPGGFLVKEDGSIHLDDGIGHTLALCPRPNGIMEQEQRYMELVPKFERYRIYGELLVVHTRDGVVLLFHAG